MENQRVMAEEKLLDSLRKASTRREIEFLFKENQVSDFEQKLETLKKCQEMESFYTPNYHDLSPEDKYAYEVDIFLQGDWKKNKLYEAMGI